MTFAKWYRKVDVSTVTPGCNDNTTLLKFTSALCRYFVDVHNKGLRAV